MSKKALNLTIEENIKERAKRIAKKRGISVSQLFEKTIIDQEDQEEFIPTPGSAVYKLMNLIPESEKLDDDYKQLKMEALKKKYDL